MTQGVKLINLDAGEHLVGLERVIEADSTAEEIAELAADPAASSDEAGDAQS